MKTFFINKLLFVTLLFLGLQLDAQQFLNKNFYLIDSLTTNELSKKDKHKLDSVLTLFHKEKNDTIRLNILDNSISKEIESTNLDILYYQYIIAICKTNEKKKLSLDKAKFYNNFLVKSFNHIGNNLLYKGDFEKAKENFNNAQRATKPTTNKLEIATTYNGLAVVHESKGEIEKTIQYLNKSLLILEAIGNKEEAATMLNNLGYIHDVQGNLPKALEHYYKAIKIQEEINDEKGLGYSYNNIGYIYERQEELENAMEYYSKALKFLKQTDKVGYGRSLNNIGHILEAKGKQDEALTYYHKALKTQEETGYKRQIVENLNAIGQIYESKKDLKNAHDYFSRAVELNKNGEDKANLSTCLLYVARVELLLGLETESFIKAKKSLEIAQELGYPISIKAPAHFLSQHYEKNGNYKEAFALYKLSTEMKDSINSENNIKATIQQKTKYQYEKQRVIDDAVFENKITIEQEGKKRQKVIATAVGIGLVLVLFFLIIIYRRLQVSKSQRIEIEKQKSLIEKSLQKSEIQKGIIENQKNSLELINKEVSDSINYAEMIQQAVLPSLGLENLKNEAFVYFNPKDRVSGDFYWLENKDKYSVYCVADCTGHGIPGAFISMIGTILLNEIYNSKNIFTPHKVLDELNRLLQLTLTNKEGHTIKDGMDMSFVLLDNETKVLYFSGANNPVWVVSSEDQKTLNEETKVPSFSDSDKFIYEVKGDKQPIGKHAESTSPFTLHSIQLVKDDCFYLFSDGYVDQFGGEKNKKFKAMAFRELLLSINKKPMEEQHRNIDQAFCSWKKDIEQIDDVTVMGIRI